MVMEVQVVVTSGAGSIAWEDFCTREPSGMQETFSVFIRVIVMGVYICKNSLSSVLIISALSAHYHVYGLLQFLKEKKNQDPLPKFPQPG